MLCANGSLPESLNPGKDPDSELAQYFDVSRTPVREAIQMLERQKLVKAIPK